MRHASLEPLASYQKQCHQDLDRQWRYDHGMLQLFLSLCGALHDQPCEFVQVELQLRWRLFWRRWRKWQMVGSENDLSSYLA